jgi:hypothetical protein
MTTEVTLPPVSAPVDPGGAVLAIILMALVMLVIGLTTWVGGIRRRKLRAEEWPFRFKKPLGKGWRDRKHRH